MQLLFQHRETGLPWGHFLAQLLHCSCSRCSRLHTLLWALPTAWCPACPRPTPNRLTAPEGADLTWSNITTLLPCVVRQWVDTSAGCAVRMGWHEEMSWTACPECLCLGHLNNNLRLFLDESGTTAM